MRTKRVWGGIWGGWAGRAGVSKMAAVEESVFQLRKPGALWRVIQPKNIACIGEEMAIVWEDGAEDYLPMERLRAYSPSAANMGEKDLLGNVYGGTEQSTFPGVTVTGWEPVGGYAIRIDFSDGHSSGIFAFDYLRRLGEFLRGEGGGLG